MIAKANPTESSKSVTVIGAGNIGSHAAPLIARLAAVRRVTLVDPGSWEPKDLRGQAVRQDQVGRPKAEALGEALRAIRPELEVRSVVERIEDVPPGQLRASVLVACLDSKRVRIAVNEAAWRLDHPWVDAGVLADGSLARVAVFAPSLTGPCYECALDASSYERLEVTYPCQPGFAREAAPTNAPAWLGSLAGSLQTAACERLLADDPGGAGVGRRMIFDSAGRQLHDGALTRNPGCRFDHRTWHPRSLDQRPADLDVKTALCLSGGTERPNPEAQLAVARKVFVRRVGCRHGHCRAVLCLEGRLPVAGRICKQCGEPLEPVGFEARSSLGHRDVSEVEAGLRMSEIGFLPGDIFSVTSPRGEQHFEFSLEK